MPTDSGLAALVEAIRARDAAAIRSLAKPDLVRAVDPNCFGATPLIHAVGTNDAAIVDLLLDLGADIDQRSDWWAGSFGVLDHASDKMAAHLIARGATLTPHAAARLGHIDRLRAMLDADPSIVRARGGDGQAPLHFARTVEIAELLLLHGAEVDALDIDHASTPAHWLGESRPAVTGYLVTRGAKPDPFMAVRIGDGPLLERTLTTEPDRVAVRVSRDRFPAPPPAAGHIYLFAIGEGCTLLHAAATSNRPDMIRLLASKGADPNARGGYDDATPLHTAAWTDHPEAAEALLDARADINALSGPTHHNEPIGWAIVGGSLSVFRVLKRRGALIKDHHETDARRGAEGAFRQFNPRRPAEAWARIADEF